MQGQKKVGKVFPSLHPADLFLRNASQSREDVRKFFDEELSPKVQEMVEKRFPVTENKNEKRINKDTVCCIKKKEKKKAQRSDSVPFLL